MFRRNPAAVALGYLILLGVNGLLVKFGIIILSPKMPLLAFILADMLVLTLLGLLDRILQRENRKTASQT